MRHRSIAVAADLPCRASGWRRQACPRGAGFIFGFGCWKGEIAIDAYVYGYSLITTGRSLACRSSILPKVEELRAPHEPVPQCEALPAWELPRQSRRRTPTRLYSLAWIDVGKEPTVFFHPDMGKRLPVPR